MDRGEKRGSRIALKPINDVVRALVAATENDGAIGYILHGVEYLRVPQGKLT